MSKRIIYNILAIFFVLTLPLCAQESSPTDDIVVKATNVVIFQMTANMKLNEDQVSAVGPIIAENIAKIRNLQQSLEDGTIESSEMYSQRQQLISDENKELGSILTPDQMKTWLIMQNESSHHSK